MSEVVTVRLGVALGLSRDQLAVLAQELITRADTIMRDDRLVPRRERAVLAYSIECEER